MDLQSRINWVRMAGVLLVKILQVGGRQDIEHNIHQIRKASLPDLRHGCPGQTARICSVVSAAEVQRLQVGSVPGTFLDFSEDLHSETSDGVLAFWSLEWF